jgi:hypothetical protein
MHRAPNSYGSRRVARQGSPSCYGSRRTPMAFASSIDHGLTPSSRNRLATTLLLPHPQVRGRAQFRKEMMKKSGPPNCATIWRTHASLRPSPHVFKQLRHSRRPPSCFFNLADRRNLAENPSSVAVPLAAHPCPIRAPSAPSRRLRTRPEAPKCLLQRPTREVPTTPTSAGTPARLVSSCPSSVVLLVHTPLRDAPGDPS